MNSGLIASNKITNNYHINYQKFDTIDSVNIQITKANNNENDVELDVKPRLIGSDNAEVSIFYKDSNGSYRPAKSTLLRITITNNGNGSLTLSGIPRASHQPSYISYVYAGFAINPKPFPIGTITARTITYINQEVEGGSSSSTIGAGLNINLGRHTTLESYNNVIFNMGRITSID